MLQLGVRVVNDYADIRLFANIFAKPYLPFYVYGAQVIFLIKIKNVKNQTLSISVLGWATVGLMERDVP